MAVKYSAVVCTYNGQRWIAECLESLAHQTITPEDYEVIVVDDGSTDGVEVVVQSIVERYSNFRLISYQPNMGLSIARNRGWQAARGEIVLYTDDDAVPDADWIERVVAEYAADVDGVGGYARPYKDDVFCLYDQGASIVVYGSHAERLDGAGGLNMSFRRKVLEQIDGFDPAFTHIADDADINRRLAKAGYKLKVVPGITVRHRSPATVTDFCKKRFRRGKLGYNFLRKYRERGLLLRSLGGVVLGVINVPRNLSFGLRVAKAVGRNDLVFQFATLAALERFFRSTGQLMAVLSDREKD